jgi:4-hydroxybenzoate polyprenyltransferase
MVDTASSSKIGSAGPVQSGSGGVAEKRRGLGRAVVTYGRMIKFSHTLFALPFALSAVVLAQRQHAIEVVDIFWVLLSMVAARSAAMGFNRITDARIDGLNTRTRTREIPAGKITMAQAVFFVALSTVVFLWAAWMLGRLCFILALPLLAVLFIYSFTKRFTWLSHLFLGFAISLAPVGAWVAMTKGMAPEIWLLSAALMTYIAGFDILYACQDVQFDRSAGLFSMPARFGVRRALQIARLVHLICLVALVALYFAFEMNGAYLITVAVIAILLIIEHRLVNPEDLSRINIAFFHVNSVISCTLLLGIVADEVVRRLA